MINREKLVALSLLTALIITLMFANSNVTSVAADPAPDPDTMTFNSNVTMEFETGNTAWIGSGKYLYCYNETKGENITELGPGTVLSSTNKPGWGYPNPGPGDWYYIYGDLYGKCIAFKIDQVWGPAGGLSFNISETWEHWLRAPRNWTGANDFHKTPLTEFEAEGMISTIETGVEYWAFEDGKLYNVAPTVGSHWNVTYHDCLFGNVFNLSSVGTGYYEEAEDAWYYPVEFGALWNTTGDIVNSITVPDAPDGFCPVEGLEGVQTITAMEPARYYVSLPAPLLPDNSTWWNITSPGELDTTQFHVKNSSKIPFRGIFRSYMDIDNVTGSTDITPPGVKSIEATWANAPKVSTIGSWYNVIDGPTPSSRTWWNITTSNPLNDTLVGVQLYVDSAGEGVFHIDETSRDVTVIPAVDNVTAEELIPFIKIEPASKNNTALVPGTSFTISIKTNYTLQVWGYEFTLEWNPDILNCTGVANMELFAGATFMNGTVDNVNGKLSLTGAQFEYGEGERAPQVYPTSDNCTLANVTFKVAGTGDSDITLGPETRLVKVTKDGKGVEQNVIDDVTGKIKRGYFVNVVGPVVHDIAVTNITCYYLGVEVNEMYQKWTVQVNVTVLNNGTLTETFDVKLYCDSWLVSAVTDIRIAGGKNTTAEFSWNLTGIYYRSHGVCGKASVVPGETDTDDNAFIGSMKVKLLGDINNDDHVWWGDFVMFCGSYLTFPPKIPANVWADLDGDGDVDGDDFQLFAGHYNKRI